MKRNILKMSLLIVVIVGLFFVVGRDTKTTVFAMSKSDYNSKINEFINHTYWRNGTAWGDNQKPKIAWNGSGCCAYVNDFARYVYGADSQNSGVKYTGVSNIKTGDVLYVYSSKYGQHWIAILERNGNNLYVAEGNASDAVRISSSEWTISGDTLYNSWSKSTYTLTYGYYYDEIADLRGCLDSCTGDTGAINVRGWAFDESNKSKAIEVHVYIGGQAGESNAERHVITANVERTDVNDAYPGVGNYHGFNARITTAKTGTQSVYVYMLNPDTGMNDYLDSKTVTITAETVPTSVSLNKSSATLTSKGSTTTLTATVSPSNATNKKVTWKSSNTSVATVNSSGVVTAVGNGTATITATTASGGKTATCKVTVSIQNSDGWYYASSLPSGVSTSTHEIQYKHVYEKYATSSPGSGWTDTGVDKTEYTKSGSTYESAVELSTSNTVRLSSYYYYHFCGGSSGVNANFTQTSTYGHYDQIKNTSTVYEHAAYTDTDDSRYKYYHLKWSDGSDAYCNTSKGTCDGAYGSHGNRSYYWYKMYVYQNYTAKTLNKYSYTSAWETSKDSSATSVSYRYRLKPTGVSLNKTSATLTSKGATVSLSATVSPSDAGNKAVTWKSSNTSVATVSSSGVVTAVGNGTATITATTSVGSKTATCKVTVNIAPTGVSLNKTSATLTQKGETVSLTATVSPSNAADKTVTWKSSNTSVATVSSSGVVTAVGNGTATITVTTSAGSKTATCKVTVSIATTGVSLNKTSATLTKKGETVSLIATVSPSNAGNKNVTWKSSNTSVATVSSSGVVTAVGNGTATITVTTESGSKTATCKVTVQTTVATPVLKYAANQGDGVEFVWNPVSNAEKYRVFRKCGASGWVVLADTTETSYIDKTVESGKTYIYTVRCVTADGKDFLSGYDSVGKSTTFISAPLISSLSADSSGVVVSWDKVTGAGKYRVFRKFGVSGWVAICDTTSNIYLDKTAEAGNTYIYTIRCISNDGKTFTSGYDAVGKKIIYAKAPQVSTLSADASGVVVNWDKVTGAEKYRVFKKNATGGWSVVGDTTGNFILDKTATKEGTYTYTVRCITADGKSFTSGYDTIGKSAKVVQMPQVTSLSADTAGVVVSWNGVTGAEKYRVFRKNTAGGWSVVGDTTGTFLLDKSAVVGMTNIYTVRCITADGKGFMSAYDTVGKGIMYTNAPTITSLSADAAGVVVSWDNVAGAEKYRVFKKNTTGGWSILGDTTGTFLLDKSAKCGGTYTYTVRCISSNGQSFTGGYDTIGKSVRFVETPQVTSLSADTTGVVVSWNKIVGADRYRVFRKTAPSGWIVVGDTVGSFFLDKTALTGVTYAYTVRCVSSDGSGFTSAYDTVGKEITFVETPQIISITSSDSGIAINWNTVNGAKAYRVFKKTATGGWSTIGDVVGTSFVDNNVIKGNTYTYTIRCISDDGLGFGSGFNTTGWSITH